MRLPQEENRSNPDKSRMVELGRSEQSMNQSENGQREGMSDSGVSSSVVTPSPVNPQFSAADSTLNGTLVASQSGGSSGSGAPNSPSSPSKRTVDGSPGSKTVIVTRRTQPTPPPGPLMYAPKENEFGKNLKILPVSCQIRELQTIIRDKNTSRSDFKFYADRLIRLVIEDSLNLLPFRHHQIITPTGSTYDGLKYERGNCGVSIVRQGIISILESGESMEAGLRDCCRSIRIGKILVESDAETHEAHVVYARFPDDIQYRKVLLMYPIMSTGNTVIKSVNVLKEHLVQEENIILANLFCTPTAVRAVLSAFPNMKILTSEVHPIAPNHFGQRYFGTD